MIVYSSSVLPGMVPWFVILLSELNFRKAHPEQLHDHPFKMPLYPAYNYFSLIMLALIVVFMFINPDTRVSVSVGIIFLAIMTVIYFYRAHKGEEDAEINKKI